jgi:aryl-alcohol dehydrogenase-like predicted oxidoreductase
MGLSRKHVREAMAKCLSRLQLEYVDIIMAHRPDAWTPMEEVVRAYTDLIREGKALYWGTSEWSAFDIERRFSLPRGIFQE